MAASDRTKKPEEIAKEEAERLHELETKRLARMNGDFDNDDLSDVSEDEDDQPKRKKRKKIQDKKKKDKNRVRGDDELDTESEDEDETTMKFTSEGLMHLDKHGNTIPDKQEEGSSEDNKSDAESEEGETETEESDVELGGSGDDASNQEDDSDGDEFIEDEDAPEILSKGMKIRGNYHAAEQYEAHATWYPGVISKVYTDERGNTLYDVAYDDGDIEDGMTRENLKFVGKSKDQKEEEQKKKMEKKKLSEKKRKAKKIAR